MHYSESTLLTFLKHLSGFPLPLNLKNRSMRVKEGRCTEAQRSSHVKRKPTSQHKSSRVLPWGIAELPKAPFPSSPFLRAIHIEGSTHQVNFIREVAAS